MSFLVKASNKSKSIVIIGGKCIYPQNHPDKIQFTEFDIDLKTPPKPRDEKRPTTREQKLLAEWYNIVERVRYHWINSAIELDVNEEDQVILDAWAKEEGGRKQTEYTCSHTTPQGHRCQNPIYSIKEKLCFMHWNEKHDVFSGKPIRF